MTTMTTMTTTMTTTMMTNRTLRSAIWRACRSHVPPGATHRTAAPRLPPPPPQHRWNHRSVTIRGHGSGYGGDDRGCPRVAPDDPGADSRSRSHSDSASGETGSCPDPCPGHGRGCGSASGSGGASWTVRASAPSRRGAGIARHHGPPRTPPSLSFPPSTHPPVPPPPTTPTPISSPSLPPPLSPCGGPSLSSSSSSTPPCCCCCCCCCCCYCPSCCSRLSHPSLPSFGRRTLQIRPSCSTHALSQPGPGSACVLCCRVWVSWVSVARMSCIAGKEE